MTDNTLFSAGSLFTQDYLSDAIKQTDEYQSVDVDAFRTDLGEILEQFPHASKPNEATTTDALIWPFLELLGWSSKLTEQNLTDGGRTDVPDGLLFIDERALAKANEHPQEWRRYEFGAAIVEAKRWGRALDRAGGRKGADRETPSTQLLRYFRRINDLTQGTLRWGILSNGAKWRLYFSGARSPIDDYLEIDLSRALKLEISIRWLSTFWLARRFRDST